MRIILLFAILNIISINANIIDDQVRNINGQTFFEEIREARQNATRNNQAHPFDQHRNKNHPVVEINDGLCNEWNTRSGVCQAYEQTVIYTQDTIYQRYDLRLINLTDTQIKCKKPNGEPCIITIKMNRTQESDFNMTDYSLISASQIYFDSPTTNLRINDKTSRIEVNGRSTNQRGTNNGQGATYIGLGGYCGDEGLYNKLYFGFHTMKPYPANIYDLQFNQLIGSIGDAKPYLDLGTSGGGHIHLDLNSLQLYGQGAMIQANGLPAKCEVDDPKMPTYCEDKEESLTNMNGGTGGYMYIDTQNNYDVDNHFSDGSFIEAIGGYGMNSGFGGAGGVIVYGPNFKGDIFHSKVHGGEAGSKIQIQNLKPEGCGNGASGTYYLFNQDMLVIDNNNIITNKVTQVYAQRLNQVDFKDEYMLAENTIIESGSTVQVKNTISSIMFPTLSMKPNTKLIFDINVPNLTIKYRQHFVVDPSTVIDLTRITNEVKFQTVSNSSSFNIVNLGTVLFSKSLVIDVSAITLNSKIFDPNESNIQETSLKLFADSIVVKQGAEIAADKILLYAKESININSNAIVRSTVENECSIDNIGNKDLYECMDLEYDETQMTQEYVLKQYNSQYKLLPTNKLYATVPLDMQAKILTKWNVYIMSLGEVRLNQAEIAGPRVGICGNNLYVESSRVHANGMGCTAGKGLGAGFQKGFCGASGGAHGGRGGYGGAESNDKAQMAQCTQNYPKPYYFGQEARYEGSGGGNGEKRPGIRDTGGSGGGIVWLTTPNTTQLYNSSIEANGVWGVVSNYDQYGSGGGAGGSIQLSTLNLRGYNSVLSAKGGMGSTQGGGGGAGGRLVMNYQKSYLADSQPNQSFYWSGHSDISGGPPGDMAFKYQAPSAGSNGTMHHSKCFPGYSGVFCKRCPVGFYKYDYSYGQCQPCQNKPKYSIYTKEGMDTSMCEYECDEWLENQSNNKDCLDPLSLQIQRNGGLLPGFAMFGMYLLISLVVFLCFSYRSQQILENLKDMHETLYQEWEEEDDRFRGRTDEEDFRLSDSNIWSHTHRMYLIGYNSISFPWFMPKDFPRDSLKKVDRDKLCKFIDEFNPEMRFGFGERVAFVLVKLLFPPLAKQMHSYLRRKKFRALQVALYRSFTPRFWSDNGDNKSLRLGCSMNDYRLAYIDFIDYGRNKENWLGLKLPMPVLLAGSGTFNTPYNLDFIDDTFAKSLVLIKFEYFAEKMPIFLENFNSQLAKLSFYKLETQVMRDLRNVVSWLEKANRAMFNHFNIKVVLYIIENQYTEVEGGIFKQKRRSFPLESIFFDCFPAMYSSLLSYVKAKLISNKSELRLALVFKRYTKKKQIKTQLRVNMMLENDAKLAYKIAVEKQESVLFDDTDQDNEEERVTFAHTGGKTLLRNDTMDNLVQESSNHKDGQGKIKAVKLVDKTKRAFSISIESSKAFELAIRKPRRKWKHYITRIRSFAYGVFLLLMKHHGKPPARQDVTVFLVVLAAVLGFDVLLLANFCFHISLPPSNFAAFGWAFIFVYPLVPFLSPLVALIAAITGSPNLLKAVGNLNATMIMFNIPLTLFLSYLSHDDPQFLLMLTLMAFVKVAISGVSAKVVQHLINPRYAKNQQKLKKILSRQSHKLALREEIIGKEVSNLIDEGGPDTQLGFPVQDSLVDFEVQEQMKQYLLDK